MEERPPGRNRVLGALRNACKQHMNIGHGMSSPAVERLVRQHAMAIFKYLLPPDKECMMSARLPHWLTPCIDGQHVHGQSSSSWC